MLVNLNTGAIPTKEQAAVLAGNDAAAKAAIAKEFGLTVAYGLNTLQKDLKYGDLMDQMANNYKKVTTVVDKTDLLYAINSSVVTKKNEKNADHRREGLRFARRSVEVKRQTLAGSQRVG